MKTEAEIQARLTEVLADLLRWVLDTPAARDRTLATQLTGVPCGRPSENPVALMFSHGPSCHCGQFLIDAEPVVELDVPRGVLVLCQSCGCTVLIPEPAAPAAKGE